MARYDYLIVGAGLYGSVFAHEATARGKKCLVIDRRGHIAGNIHCETVEGIQVHRYGAHIFHTSDREVWDYVNRFSEFNHYVNSPIALYHDELYNLPFNMNTFSKLWGIRTPAEAKAKIAEQIAELDIGEPKNLEEQALKLVGRDVYEKLVKGYTEKQWGRKCSELPAFIIKRLPVRLVFDNNYFNDAYQGNAVVNYTSHEQPFTRIIEHKHFEMFGQAVYDCPKTVVSEEYSAEYRDGMEQYYPVNDDKNNQVAEKYRTMAAKQKDVVFGGRLAEYKYYDMAPILEKVMESFI